MNFSFEIIKEELNKMKKSDCEEDEVWILKLDRLHDFNTYFSKDNPASIGLRYLQKVQKNFNNDAPGTVIIEQIR